MDSKVTATEEELEMRRAGDSLSIFLLIIIVRK